MDKKKFQRANAHSKNMCDTFLRRRTVSALTNQHTNNYLLRKFHHKSRNTSDGDEQFGVEVAVVQHTEAQGSRRREDNNSCQKTN